MVHEPIAATERLKALGDPIRWNVLHQIAEQGELAASRLEETLPVSKPTISYHIKILSQAGLIDVLKRGRNYYYSVRGEALGELLDELGDLMTSGPALMTEPTVDDEIALAETALDVPDRPARPRLRKAIGDSTVHGDAGAPATLLTW